MQSKFWVILTRVEYVYRDSSTDYITIKRILWGDLEGVKNTVENSTWRSSFPERNPYEKFSETPWLVQIKQYQIYDSSDTLVYQQDYSEEE
jgi:hypothetical protein